MSPLDLLRFHMLGTSYPSLLSQPSRKPQRAEAMRLDGLNELPAMGDPAPGRPIETGSGPSTPYVVISDAERTVAPPSHSRPHAAHAPSAATPILP
jgi:hypothetical protein